MGTRTLGKLGAQAKLDPAMLDWTTRVTDYLANTADLNGGNPKNAAGTPNGPQVFTGCATFLGGYSEDGILGLGIPTVKVSRMAPVSAGGVNPTLAVLTTMAANTSASEWASFTRIINKSNATAGGAVAVYGQAYKQSLSPIFGAVFETQDTSGDATSGSVGIEVDVCFNGLDTLSRKIGLNIVYGDATPNTLNPSGPTVSVGNLIQCDPFGGITRFQALSAFRPNGTYSKAALDLEGLTNTPFAITFPGGSHLRFLSSTSGYSRTYWYPNSSYVPAYIGAIEIDIDGSFTYIPVAGNKP
jgi:hypothetical protein